MLELEKIVDVFTPFCFIKDIETICLDFKNCHSEDDAIELRKRLKNLRQQPYYPMLNQIQIDDAIYQGLIYLGHRFPINQEDPISLEECDEHNSVIISSGHRFKFDTFALYSQRQAYHQMKNPFNNETIDYQDAMRILIEMELRYPKAFNSFEQQYNKELFLWTLQIKKYLRLFLNESPLVQTYFTERLIMMNLTFRSIFIVLLMHFIFLNYYVLLKRANVPEISIMESKVLMASNLLSIAINQQLFQHLLPNLNCLPAKLKLSVFSTIINSFAVIGADLGLTFISHLISPKLSDSGMRAVKVTHAFMMFYAFYFICLQLKYPRRQMNLPVILEFSLIEAGLFTLSHLIKTFHFSLLKEFQTLSSVDDLALVDYTQSFPMACILYLYVSELKMLGSRFLEFLMKRQEQRPNHDAHLPEVFENIF